MERNEVTEESTMLITVTLSFVPAPSQSKVKFIARVVSAEQISGSVMWSAERRSVGRSPPP